MKKLALIISGAFSVLMLAGISALWWEGVGESILGVSSPIWKSLIRFYGAETVDQALDLAFGLSVLAAFVAVVALLTAGHAWWKRASGANFVFYVSLLAFDVTALLLMMNAFWWLRYIWKFISASSPYWISLKTAYGIDGAYCLLDWAFPVTSLGILAVMMCVAYGIIRRRVMGRPHQS